MNINTLSNILANVDRLFHREEFKRSKPQNPNEVAEREMTTQDKIALAVTGALGTMWAVYFFAVFMGAWMIWQGSLSKQAFDPYPYAFLLFIGNIIQLLLMPLIMVSQNVQGRHAELRAEEAYKATLSSYHDAEYMMDHLAAIDTELLRHRELLIAIANAHGAVLPSDSEDGISVPLQRGDVLVTRSVFLQTTDDSESL
jgi:uncharacterized membrane protein